MALIAQDKTARFLCPHCSTLSLHSALSATEGKVEQRTRRGESPLVSETFITVHVVFRCVGCNGDTYCLVRYNKEDGRYPLKELLQAEWSEALGDGRGSVLYQYPVVSPKTHRAVNKGVAKAAIEAEKCLSVGAFNACAVMTRRAMHSLCEDKKAKGKDLFAQLRDLKDKQSLTCDLWEWAEELRILGRSGAHPDWEEVSKADATYGVNFLREILKYVYILPFERSQRRMKETSKKKP